MSSWSVRVPLPEWKSMTLKRIAFRGQRYDITIDRDANGRIELTRKRLTDAQEDLK
jgi:hypothetical protein